jgi:putative methyltransferase (TIGR04325 family)
MNIAGFRVRQIKASSTLIRLLCRIPNGPRFIKCLRSLPPYRTVMGYMRPFDTLRDAYTAVAPYSEMGHENPENARLHLRINATARGSDYPVLFHMRPILPDVRRILDVGGNVGNLFYCYAKYLDLSNLIWEVLDLPYNISEGRRLAKFLGQQGKLIFTDAWQDAAQADLAIISGSIHYFETPMYEIIAQFEQKPPYILINRAPLTEGQEVAVVQEAGGYRVACMLYNRVRLISGFEKIGYELMDSWQANDLSFRLPGYPEHTVPAYTGLFFRLASATNVARAE